MFCYKCQESEGPSVFAEESHGGKGDEGSSRDWLDCCDVTEGHRTKDVLRGRYWSKLLCAWTRSQATRLRKEEWKGTIHQVEGVRLESQDEAFPF